MTSNEPQTAAIYVRISLDKTGAGLGVARQEKACADLAAARGWTVVRTYTENDTSASAKRPQYAAMLRAAKNNDFDVIVAWAVDRLTRSPREIEDLITLSEATGVMVATVSGDLDLTTDQGRLVGRILGAVARGEVERKGARQTAANRQRALDGRVSVAGIRTLGYTPGMAAVVPAEATQIKAGFAGFIAGRSLRGIAAQWNAATPVFRTAHGHTWTAFAVRKVLRNPRYAGRSVHQGAVVAAGRWEALVTGDTFDTVQTILDDPARRTTPDTTRKYLLPGIATCECGGGILTGRTQHGVRTYFCSQSKHLSRAAAPVDAWVIELAVHRLARPDAADLTIAQDRPGTNELRGEAAALHARLAQFADMVADGDMDRQQFARASGRVRARLDTVTGLMADAARVDVLAPLIDAAGAATTDTERLDRVNAVWDSLSLDVQRAVITTLFAAVVIHPPGRGARTFNPATITLEWRQ